jgi:hypothetical protein
MVNAKIAKRVDPWQGRLMSSRCILILVNSCLSIIPTYIMGFYHVTDGQHEGSMRRFFRMRGGGGGTLGITWLNGKVLQFL